MGKEIRLTKTMREVMKALYTGRDVWQTTNEVSHVAGVSWMTAREKLRELKKAGKVERKRRDGRTYWKI